MNEKRQRHEYTTILGLPLTIPVIVSYNGNNPCLWLRRQCTNKDVMKKQFVTLSKFIKLTRDKKINEILK